MRRLSKCKKLRETSSRVGNTDSRICVGHIQPHAALLARGGFTQPFGRPFKRAKALWLSLTAYEAIARALLTTKAATCTQTHSSNPSHLLLHVNVSICAKCFLRFLVCFLLIAIVDIVYSCPTPSYAQSFSIAREFFLSLVAKLFVPRFCGSFALSVSTLARKGYQRCRL